MPKSTRSAARRETKRENAEARQRQRDELTPEEQIKILDDRLGVGQGATKERARLAKLMEGRK